MIKAKIDSKTNRIQGFKTNKDPNLRLTIEIFDDNAEPLGLLLCVDEGMSADRNIIYALTTWRQRYMKFFLTQFKANVNRTKAWLENIVIPSPDRLLFIIQTSSGKSIGNFGVCNMAKDSGELDNLIRGERGGPPGLIYYSEVALLSWMFGDLGYEWSNLHVFSNNAKTVKLHSTVGFSLINSYKLSKRVGSELNEYYLDAELEGSVDFTYLEMMIKKKDFLNLHPWVYDVYQYYWK